MFKKLLLFTIPIFMLVFALTAEAAIPTNQKIFNYFKTAIGNRYGSLGNAGRTAIWNFIVTNNKISVRSIDTIANMSNRNKLNFFGQSFGSAPEQFNDQAKTAIKTAFINRYTDLCHADFDTAVKSLITNYRNTLKNAERVKATAIATCNTNHKNAFKSLSKANQNYYFIKSEKMRIDKEICVNNAYTVFNNTALAAQTALESNVAVANYTDCLTNQTRFDWLQPLH